VVAEDLTAQAGGRYAAASGTGARTGGHLVAESLEALGAEVVFGVPGIHSLAIWEGVRTSRLRAYGARTELCAGFAADGYARSSGRPAPLLLSTGPGALNSLTALMESASSHVPVVAISGQIPRELIGRGRGFLHELPDQLASFASVVKHVARAESTEVIPEQLSEAWAIALTPPSGPVYLEIPVDILTAPTRRPPVGALTGLPSPRGAEPGMVAAAAHMLAAAERPVIWAGGGVQRARAQAELGALAELLDAPVVTTYMGKGALPDTHPLAVGSGCDETAVQEVLSGADVLLCVGTELGAETTSQYSLNFSGQLIHVDAVPARIGATYPALPLVGDAKLTLAKLLMQLPQRSHPEVRGHVAELRERVRRGLQAQDKHTELELLAVIEQALPADAISTWDMTILGYWAAAHLRLRGEQQFMYPLGSGTLGYAWPAAIGASIAHPDRAALAVVGDGGLAYALAELATARQYAVSAKLVVIDDGGFGILREYQRHDYGETTAVDLVQPDFTATAAAFGVPARLSAPGELRKNLAWALSCEGPAMVVVPVTLTAAQPTR
jgi:acetolactate synthase-1/2/3 large subunit